MYLIYATSHHHCPTIFWCIWLSLSDLQSSDHQSGNNSGKGKGKRRDMSRFWTDLKERGLIGTIGAPVSSSIENPAEVAAARVRQLRES